MWLERKESWRVGEGINKKAQTIFRLVAKLPVYFMKFEKVEDIWIWRESIDLCDVIYKMSAKSASKGILDCGLFNHMKRTAVSIPSNIAEGHGRESPMEFRRFLFIARGSCVELNTQLIIANKVGELVDNDFHSLEEKCKRVCAGIFNLIRYLSDDSNEKKG